MKAVAAALLGMSAATLIACGSSGTGLIPAASAGPLQSDFEAVSRAAQSANGNCLETESALGKTQQDYLALPTSVDAGLRKRLHEGIVNLRRLALDMCAQPSPTATTTSTQTTRTPTTSTGTQTAPSTTTSTQTATTQTSTTQTPPAGPGNSGGTPAEEAGGEESAGKGKGKGKGAGEGNGDSGGASPEGGK